MRVFYRAGLRCAEALALRPRDVVLARHEIRVNAGKGAKDRVVWIDEATVEILTRWKEVRPLATADVRKMLARRGRKAGIELRCHPHLLRHSFASELLEDGASLVEVKELLGHERLETTAIYSHVANERLRRFLVDRA